jgi:hypothetical protein
VQQLGVDGWRLDMNTATEAGIISSKPDDDEIGGYTIGPSFIARSTSSTNHLSCPSFTGKGQVQPLLGFSRTHNHKISKTLSSGPSMCIGLSKSMTEHWNNAPNAPPVKRELVHFKNPSHPLSGMPSDLSREEFVQEVRRRLRSEPLFGTVAHYQESCREPVLSAEDSEDLFEALLLLQGKAEGQALQTGRQLDAACDKFFALVRLRQLMERGATSLSAFFNMLDLGGRNGLEPSELKRFLKNVGGDFLSGMAAALAAEGVDVNRLAETMFAALDTNKDHKVELWEMKRQLSLAAPPRMSMVDVVGHFEMKNGYGKCGLQNIQSRAQLFDHMARQEGLDLSPEDVARCFRIIGAGDKSSSQFITADHFDTFLRGLPVEVTWGLEPHVGDRVFCALGARLLQLERVKQMDACLPIEGLLIGIDDTRDKEQEEADVHQRFQRIWERCMKDTKAIEGTAGKQLRDCCFRRLVDAIENLKERYRQAERLKYEYWRDLDLKKLARSIGADDEDIEEADDAQDSRSALVELVLKLEKGVMAKFGSIRVNDKVTWVNTCSSVPKGTTGTVTSFTESEVEVQFPRITMTLPHAELVKAVLPQPSSQLQRPNSPQRANSPKLARQQAGHLPTLTRAAVRALSLPRSLFPNISDVLVTASLQMQVGQAFIVRYRLTGSSSFWGPNHEVVMNDRDTIPWPCPRKLLGETPCIGLVPCGQKESSAFPRGQIRADLPRDATSGHPLLFGTVEITPPSLVRTARSGFDGLTQDFELRLFCGTKHKITGYVGEPLMVTVVHQVRPPPVATLQVRCEGRSAVLKWSALDLGPQARRTNVEAVRLHMKSAQSERCFSLEADATEWEVQDLAPDTEFEFRIRLENRAGPGREAFGTVRTNARCSAPTSLTCAVSGTASVELRWCMPKTIGNENTKDRYQQNREAIESYEASLRVEDDENDGKGASADDIMDEFTEMEAPSTTPVARKCRWPVGSWTEVPRTPGGNDTSYLTGRLNGLRPDTRYKLERFCGINSMGQGAICKSLVFWTVPQTPRIASVRVKHGQVLVALSQTGGVSIKEFMVVVSLTDKPGDKPANFDLPASNLREDHEGAGQHPELTLPFDAMPPTDSVKKHSITLRVQNPGGWSDWSATFEACAISRQQGAEQSQLALLQAMKDRRIEALTRLLAEVREIEFTEKGHVEKATVLLKELSAARSELSRTMQARDPAPLLQALIVARKVHLPDIGKAEALLRKLEGVVYKLEMAKGIEQLRSALKAAHEARLPSYLLTAAIQRLGTREAAQQGLLEAMEAARVPGLRAALQTSVGMDLPSEEEGHKLLVALEHSETLLNEAVEKAFIVDLVKALEFAEEKGLREDGLIDTARKLLADLHEKQELQRSNLEIAMEARHPEVLKDTLDAAEFAQVLDKDLKLGSKLLEHLEGIIAGCEAAVGVDERRASLDAAYKAEVPAILLEVFEEQLEKLKSVHSALKRGSVEVLRKALKYSDRIGVKVVELAEAKVVYADWHAASHELEVSLSVTHAERLRDAIAAATAIGIAQDQVESASATLEFLVKRDQAKAHLQKTMMSRKCEPLSEALRAACDAEVQDTEMLQEARFLVHWLTKMRLKLSKAIETNDLKQVCDTFGEASAYPSLPHSELAKAKNLLEDLQQKESNEIKKELLDAHAAGNWRLLHYLVVRAKRVAQWGVKVDKEELIKAEEVAREFEKKQRAEIEMDIMDLRLRRECVRWEWQVPTADEAIQLPTSTVTGDLTVYFNAGGTYLATLPREIVEGKLVLQLKRLTWCWTSRRHVSL